MYLCTICHLWLMQAFCTLQDYRGLQSKVCSTSSLNSEPASAGQSLSNAIEIARDDACETSSLLGRDNPDSLPLSPPVSSMMQSGKSSNPISIKNKRLPRDLILSSSAPTSASSSPLPGHRNSPRQQFYRVRKSSSSSSLTVFVGRFFRYLQFTLLDVCVLWTTEMMGQWTRDERVFKEWYLEIHFPKDFCDYEDPWEWLLWIKCAFLHFDGRMSFCHYVIRSRN